MASRPILPIIDHVRPNTNHPLIFRHKKVLGHLARPTQVEPLRPEYFLLVLHRFVPTALDVDALEDQANTHPEEEAC